MKIEFVPYELALRMRNLGFNEPCFVWADVYTKENVYMYPTNENNMNQYNETVSIPLFQQAFRWFDENTSCQGFIIPSIKEGHFDWEILNLDTEEKIECTEYYYTRKEAELACLEKLIEIIELKSDYEREE